MQTATIRATSVSVLILAVGACSGSATKTNTPTGPSNPTNAIVINAPVPVSPSDGATATGWPTLTVNNATHSGPAGALTYRFDISTASDFTNIIDVGAVAEGGGQTTYTSTKTPLPSDQSTLYWRATAMDLVNTVQSPASTTQSFKEANPPTKAAQIASQQGVILWPGQVPPGDPGHATMGNGWNVAQLTSYDGVAFMSPTLDELQVFDCIDRGMQPQQAIDWMHGHGYGTPAGWYPDIAVIAFTHQYLAFIGGRWDMVLRAGA